MPRVRLIHWKPAEAADEIRRLKDAGYRVDHRPLDPSELRGGGGARPAAMIIDLNRIPSHGRDVGVAMRTAKPTRRVPLVFVGGDPEKVARIRELLPDACYTTWGRIRGALERAIAAPPTDPVVPGSRMAGYSGTPLPKKLGIKSGYNVALIGAPRELEMTLGQLPDGAKLRRRLGSRPDLILWFLKSSSALERGIDRMAAATGSGGLWIAWPKKASGVVTDLSQARVREVGLASGLVDYKICAIDATWSGLRFARRKRR